MDVSAQGGDASIDDGAEKTMNAVIAAALEEDRIRVLVKPIRNYLMLVMKPREGRSLLDSYSPGDVIEIWCGLWSLHLLKVGVKAVDTFCYKAVQRYYTYNVALRNSKEQILTELLYGLSAQLPEGVDLYGLPETHYFWPCHYTLDGVEEVADTPDILIEQLNRWTFYNAKRIKDFLSAVTTGED